MFRAIMLILTATVAGAAFADPDGLPMNDSDCFGSTGFEESLEAAHGAIPVWQGMTKLGHLYRLYRNRETGTWALYWLPPLPANHNEGDPIVVCHIANGQVSGRNEDGLSPLPK